MGISIAVGLCIAFKKKNQINFCSIGDGECNEDQIRS